MDTKKFLQNIFSVRNQGNCKVFCILGKKFKISRIIDKQGVKFLDGKIFNAEAGIKTRIINELRVAISASRIHKETFAQYKNCNAGKDVVLVASGPSLNDYIPIENTVNLAVNRSIFYDKVKFDYLFMQDYIAVKSYIENSINYKNSNLKRFYGILQPELVDGWTIPESLAIRHNASRYYVRSSWDPNSVVIAENFSYDIESLPLICHGSVVFPAMQFLLYTNPRRIYLVGCDCSNNGYFSGGGTNSALDPTWMKIHWEKLKKFADTYYPETEIISVNPVGLKGLFKDLVQ